MIILNEKPSWDDAPVWAQSLGVAVYGVNSMQWCWFAGTDPTNVFFIEYRQNKEDNDKELRNIREV